MVVYRWLPGLSPDEPSPEETLNHICERLTAGLKAAGISAVRQNEQAIHRWLVRWFNPRRPLRIKSLLATTGFTGRRIPARYHRFCRTTADERTALRCRERCLVAG